MTPRLKVLISILALTTAFAFGRFLTPEKIKVEKQIVEVQTKEKEQEKNVEKDKHKEVIVTKITKKDGTQIETTKTVEDTKASRESKDVEKDQTKRQEKTEKEVTKSPTKVNVSLLGAYRLGPSSPNLAYGAQVSANIIGPIRTGIWGLNNGTLGVSIGLDF